MTTDSILIMYQNGKISYWDYIFVFHILNGNPTTDAAILAIQTASGGEITNQGKLLASQALIDLGRESEIVSIPGSPAILPVVEVPDADVSVPIGLDYSNLRKALPWVLVGGLALVVLIRR